MKATFRPKPEPPELPDQHPKEQADYEWALASWYLDLEKHPHVQEVMHIPADEPIFVMRSQDINAPESVNHWLELSQAAVSPKKFISAATRYQEMLEWQNVQPPRVKIPD